VVPARLPVPQINQTDKLGVTQACGLELCACELLGRTHFGGRPACSRSSRSPRVTLDCDKHVCLGGEVLAQTGINSQRATAVTRRERGNNRTEQQDCNANHSRARYSGT
jgi:hypothetical protein